MNPTYMGLPARLVACCTASSAFTVAILTGLFVGNTIDSTVSRALAAMVVCYIVGRLVGWAIELILRERLRAEESTGAAVSAVEVEEEPIDVSPVSEPIQARAA